MSDFKDRVIAERDELHDRTAKLKAFLKTEIFRGLPDAERDRLTVQMYHMSEYLRVLYDRILNDFK